MHGHKLETLDRVKDGQIFPLAGTKRRHSAEVMPMKPGQQRLQHRTDSVSSHQQLSELEEQNRSHSPN